MASLRSLPSIDSSSELESESKSELKEQKEARMGYWGSMGLAAKLDWRSRGLSKFAGAP